MANERRPAMEVKKIEIIFSRPTKRQLQLVVNTEGEALSNIPILQAGLTEFTYELVQPLQLSMGRTLHICLRKCDEKWRFRKGTGTDEADATLSFIDAQRLNLSAVGNYDHTIHKRPQIKVTLSVASESSIVAAQKHWGQASELRENQGAVLGTDMAGEETRVDPSADSVGEEMRDEYAPKEEEEPMKKGKGKAQPLGEQARQTTQASETLPNEMLAPTDLPPTDTDETQLALSASARSRQMEIAGGAANATSVQFFSGANNIAIHRGTFNASVHVHHHHEEQSGSTLSVVFPPKLPPKPQWLVGRDANLEGIVTGILRAPGKPPARIAILGDGGFGKTTLALGALHDERIVSRYGTDGRLFVSCEGATTPELLVTSLANGLHIDVAARDSHIFSHIVSRLQSTVGILCLDNFETPWDPPEHRRAVEDLLRHLAGIPSLSLIITMRGIQRPSGIAWENQIHPLSPLNAENATKMFLAVSDQGATEIDKHAQKLLEIIEYIPLAISIVAQLIRDGEAPQLLLQRWKEEGTAAVSNGVDDRAFALDASIRLSVNSPRMREVPFATELLAMLALLPAGILESGEIVEKLISALPKARFRLALQTLKRVALVQRSSNQLAGEVARYRLLSPIAQWATTNLKFSDNTFRALATCYSEFISSRSSRSHRSDPSQHAIVVPELLNVHTVIHAALHRNLLEDRILEAVTEYSVWSNYLGRPSTELVLLAISRATGSHVVSSRSFGELQGCLGKLYCYLDELDAAERALDAALALHQQAQNVPVQASTRESLGDLYLRQNRLNDAERSLEAALVLHQQAHNMLGQANTREALGDLYMRQDRLQDAERALDAALALHQQAQDMTGQANTHQSLGKLYMRQYQLDDAARALEAALALHQQAQDVLGQANTQHGLGVLYVQRDQLDDAERALEAALALYQQAQSVLGKANTHESLGVLYSRQDRLDDAERALKLALVLHQQAQDALGEGYDQQNLAVLYLQQNCLNDAESALEAALLLHRQAQFAPAEADDLRLLEDLRTRKAEISS